MVHSTHTQTSPLSLTNNQSKTAGQNHLANTFKNFFKFYFPDLFKKLLYLKLSRSNYLHQDNAWGSVLFILMSINDKYSKNYQNYDKFSGWSVRNDEEWEGQHGKCH